MRTHQAADRPVPAPPGAPVGEVVFVKLKVVERFPGEQELIFQPALAQNRAEALRKLIVPPVSGRAVAVSVRRVEAAQGGGVVHALVVEDAVRSQLHALDKLAVADLAVRFAAEAHGDEPARVHVGQLRRGHVLVPLVGVVIPVRVLDGQRRIYGFKLVGRLVRPGELGKQNDLYAHGADLCDRVFQLLPRAQPRVGIVRGVAAVLAADVPARHLERADAVLRALLADLRQLPERNAQLVLRRVELHLQPCVRLLRPAGAHVFILRLRVPVPADAGIARGAGLPAPPVPLQGKGQQVELRFWRDKGHVRYGETGKHVHAESPVLGKEPEIVGVSPAGQRFCVPGRRLHAPLRRADIKPVSPLVSGQGKGKHGRVVHLRIDGKGRAVHAVRRRGGLKGGPQLKVAHVHIVPVRKGEPFAARGPVQVAQVGVVHVFHKYAVVVPDVHAEHGLVAHNLAHRLYRYVMLAAVFGYDMVPGELHFASGACAFRRPRLLVSPGVVVPAPVVAAYAVVLQRQHKPPGQGQVRAVQNFPVRGFGVEGAERAAASVKFQNQRSRLQRVELFHNHALLVVLADNRRCRLPTAQSRLHCGVRIRAAPHDQFGRDRAQPGGL